MTNSTIRTVVPAVNTIDASVLESVEAVNHRLKDGGIALHLIEVKDLITERLKRSHFLKELTGKVQLTQFDAVNSLNRELAQPTLKAQKPTPAAMHLCPTNI